MSKVIYDAWTTAFLNNTYGFVLVRVHAQSGNNEFEIEILNDHPIYKRGEFFTVKKEELTSFNKEI